MKLFAADIVFHEGNLNTALLIIAAPDRVTARAIAQRCKVRKSEESFVVDTVREIGEALPDATEGIVVDHWST